LVEEVTEELRFVVHQVPHAERNYTEPMRFVFCELSR